MAGRRPLEHPGVSFAGCAVRSINLDFPGFARHQISLSVKGSDFSIMLLKSNTLQIVTCFSIDLLLYFYQ